MKYIKQTFSKTKLALSLSAALVLTACGGTDQDDGTPLNFEQVLSGRAIDGQLARATVYADSNNNGTRDPWEVFAFTDNDGYYSFNPITNTDYCASDASAQEAQYCLRLNTDYKNIVIRIDGGYDVLTGEPFIGQMSRRVNLEEQTDTTDILVSPITSLLTNVDTQTNRDTLLNSLGLQASDANVDYLNTDGAGAIDANLLNTALKIHKTVAVLSDRLTDTYTEIGEDFGTPNDATSAVYPNLAQQIINSGNNVDTALKDQNLLTTVLDNAEAQIREVYERKEFDLPADMGSISNPNQFMRVTDIASQIPSVVDNLIDTTISDITIEKAKGGASALETLVIKTVNETSEDDNITDSSIENAISFFTNENNDDLIKSLTDALSSKTADINGLSNNDFTGDDFDSIEKVSQASSLPENAAPFKFIGGYTLKVSDLDLGFAPNKLDDSELEFYFNGNNNAIEGSFSACVKHIDDANIDGSLGEGNTRGELVDGFWSMLGANSYNAPETYSLLITITFLSTTYQAILKPAGSETINGTEYNIIRFDNDGEIKRHHSVEGLVETESVPSTNQECEARLPSRIGI